MLDFATLAIKKAIGNCVCKYAFRKLPGVRSPESRNEESGKSVEVQTAQLWNAGRETMARRAAGQVEGMVRLHSLAKLYKDARKRIAAKKR